MTSGIDSPSGIGFIDLHAHTDESDGTYSPSELVTLAREIGLNALAITDHDTFSGYEAARPFAEIEGLDLIWGIELNTRMSSEPRLSRRAVHLLAYFLGGPPSAAFTTWLEKERAERRTRNELLAQTLQARGVAITAEEVEARGRSLAGRPHFARILVERGYARNSEEAFSRYLGEDAPSFVPRQSNTAVEVIAMIRAAGGVPVVAHPVRLGLPRSAERELLVRYREAGLLGLEIYHSEHSPEQQAYYQQLAQDLELLPSGGSDFHGALKPDIELGTGSNGNVRVPRQFLEGLRQTVAA